MRFERTFAFYFIALLDNKIVTSVTFKINNTNKDKTEDEIVSGNALMIKKR